MQAKAIAKYIRMSPRKVRLVVDVIRGKNVRDAEDLLRFIPHMASMPITKVLKSAKANATNNHDMIEDRLFVEQAFVDAGPTLKRLIPRARGSANILHKRTSHITIVLGERDEVARPVRTANKAEAKPAAKKATRQSAQKEAE